MNALTPPSPIPVANTVDVALLRHLAHICEDLDLPELRFEEAKARYEAIGKLLADPENPLSKYDPQIYAQGSTRLQTANRPLKGDEFDVDLICEFRNLAGKPVEEAFKEVRQAILADKTYEKMPSVKKRCVRITYANLFHLDITPGKPDPRYGPENLCITDLPSRQWKGSNPKDYAAWFAGVAAAPPRVRVALQKTTDFEALFETRAEVEPLDKPKRMRPVLNRIVQIFKRHRDVMYGDNKNAPISAIITTLAAHAYAEACQTEKESLLDLIIDVARIMTRKLGPQISSSNGMPIFSVPNPRHPTENFADKWPHKPQRQQEFFLWNTTLVKYLEGLRTLQGKGLDVTHRYLAEGFGEDLVRRSVIERAQRIKAAAANGKVGITAGGALVSVTTARVAAAPQTFHN